MKFSSRHLSRGLCLALFSINAWSANIAIGRYLSVPLQAKLEQRHLLSQTIQIHFPNNVRTLGQAINFSLQFTGYRLVTHDHLSPTTMKLLTLPLPEVNRILGPISLQQALLTLAGPAFSLLIDPVHRLISFRKKTTLLKENHHATITLPHAKLDKSWTRKY